MTLERQHADFWLAMAEAYGHLKQTYAMADLDTLNLTDTICDSSVVNELKTSDKLNQILSNTVSLFRPYFTWRQLALKSDTRQTKVDVAAVDTEEPIGHLCEQESVSRDVLDGKCDGDSDVYVSLCHKDCPFYSHFKVSLPESHTYSTVLSKACPQLNSFCLLHSPFVMLASRQVTVEQFIELLKSTTKAIAHHLLSSVCELSKISCHLWARYMTLCMYCVYARLVCVCVGRGGCSYIPNQLALLL